MFGYYLQLAVRSLRRNKVLTALMVLSIAVGIGASMTTLTVMHLLSGDPLPGKSQRIFHPQVDPMPDEKMREFPPDMMDYTSAVDLWRAGRADRQALVVDSGIQLRAPDTGAPARVAVISADLNDRLFGGGNSVGRILRIRDSDVRVIGVLKPWRPSPVYYTVAGGRFSAGDTAGYYDRTEDVFVPFFTGLEINDGHFSQFTCWALPGTPGHLQNSPCVWLQLWVQLDTPAKVADYRRFLAGYAAQQQAMGRIRHAGNARMPGLMEWLDFNGVVPSDVKLQAWLALAFLAICLFNTVGLLLAKFLRRGGEIGVRRALGATRRSIFAQCLVEAGLIGLVGGALGLVLTLAGLWAVRRQPIEYADLAHLDPTMFAATFALALAASLVAGLFPASRASRVVPAMQLKTL